MLQITPDMLATAKDAKDGAFFSTFVRQLAKAIVAQSEPGERPARPQDRQPHPDGVRQPHH
jgi:hypothetical protein